MSNDSEAPETQLPPQQRTGLISDIFAYLIYSLVYQINSVRLKAMEYGNAERTRDLNWNSLRTKIGNPQRLSVICRSYLSVLLIIRLINFRSVRNMKIAVKHALAVMSQMHIVGLKNRVPSCFSKLQKYHAPVYSIAFHPSGKSIASGTFNGNTHMWGLNADCSTGSYLSSQGEHRSSVLSVAFDRSGKYLVTGSYDKIANLWKIGEDGSDPKFVYMMRGHTGPVSSVAFDHSGEYLLSTSDNLVKLWKIKNGSDSQCVCTKQEHDSFINSVEFHPIKTNFFSTGGNDGVAKLWQINKDWTDITCVCTLPGHDFGVKSVAFHPSGEILGTSSVDNTVKLWKISRDCMDAKCVCTLQGHSGCVNFVTFDSSGKFLLTGGNDKVSKLWLLNPDCSAATCVCTLEGHTSFVKSARFHPFGPYIATCSTGENHVKLWR